MFMFCYCVGCVFTCMILFCPAFEEAEKNAPAIIFIDELDAIAPKRDKVSHHKTHVHSRE